MPSKISVPSSLLPLVPDGFTVRATSEPDLYIMVHPDGQKDVVWWSDQPSRTLQGPSADADINNIVKQLASGARQLPPTRGYYGDQAASPQDLAEALNLINSANNAFMALPPQVRQQMNNDPGQLQSWLLDPDNRAMGEKYGLLEPRKAQIEPLPVASPTPPPDSTPKGGESK